jgi:hypothetical protein
MENEEFDAHVTSTLPRLEKLNDYLAKCSREGFDLDYLDLAASELAAGTGNEQHLTRFLRLAGGVVTNPATKGEDIIGMFIVILERRGYIGKTNRDIIWDVSHDDAEFDAKAEDLRKLLDKAEQIPAPDAPPALAMRTTPVKTVNHYIRWDRIDGVRREDRQKDITLCDIEIPKYADLKQKGEHRASITCSECYNAL